MLLLLNRILELGCLGIADVENYVLMQESECKKDEGFELEKEENRNYVGTVGTSARAQLTAWSLFKMLVVSILNNFKTLIFKCVFLIILVFIWGLGHHWCVNGFLLCAKCEPSSISVYIGKARAFYIALSHSFCIINYCTKKYSLRLWKFVPVFHFRPSPKICPISFLPFLVVDPTFY